MPAAIAIPLALAAGSAVSGVVGAKMQSGAAKDAAKLQTDAANHGADVQDAAAQRAEAFQRQQAENAWQNAQVTQRANYDQSKARYGSIAGVAGQYGLNLGAMPDYAEGIDPHYDNASSPMPGTAAGSASGGDAGKLKALLDGGMDPQQAVAQFNQQYGRTTGNEAVYYDPSKHGGVAAIGLPDAYLAKPGQSWDITNRGGGTVSSAGRMPAMAAPGMSAPQVNTPLPTPYAGTIAAYGRMR